MVCNRTCICCCSVRFASSWGHAEDLQAHNTVCLLACLLGSWVVFSTLQIGQPLPTSKAQLQTEHQGHIYTPCTHTEATLMPATNYVK
jgi:hypothetical protein